MLDGADLTDADMRRSTVSACDLRGANLKGVNLEGGRIDAINLSELVGYKGMRVSASEQEALLVALGITVVWPETKS